ncbi:MAG TPA: hypothetical protein DF383_09820 [Deltaproteobacteria bacterium]|nr:hypothetical protein [Deltaproteobacteria bacterium]
MKGLASHLKISVAFFCVLFLAQIAWFVFAPSFYVSSLKQSAIPGFIRFSFIEHLGLIGLVYLLAALLLGLLNTWLLGLSGAERFQNSRLAYLSLLLAQCLWIYLAVIWTYPSLLGNISWLENKPLKESYVIFFSAALIVTLLGALLFRPRSFRQGGAWLAALLTPLALHLPLFSETDFSFPQARPSESRNVLLLSFDALDGDSGNRVLKNHTQNSGAVFFGNAFTPLPATHPAWHSILSGSYPHNHGTRFFFDSPFPPKDSQLYLQRQLKERGAYQTLFVSDQPETSYFTAAQGFDAAPLGAIGWEAHLRSMLLNHFIFAALWLNNGMMDRLWGTTFNSPSIFNYDLPRFFNFSMRNFDALPGSAKFLALHSCHLHTPVQLRRSELAGVEKYLDLSPKDFSYWKWSKPGDPLSRTPPQWKNPYFVRRPQTLRYLGELVEELRTKKYLDSSLVVFISDHGERFIPGYEIYGGIHGIDLETREQSNVMMAFFDPRFHRSQDILTPVSLVDLAPTVLELLGWLRDRDAYDGVPLLNQAGWLREIAPRPLSAESMGLVKASAWKGKFPQIPVDELESNLIYHPDGRVTIRPEHYPTILSRKEFLDLLQKPELFVQSPPSADHEKVGWVPRSRTLP